MTVRAEVLSVERGVATVRASDGEEERTAAFAVAPGEEPEHLRREVARWWYAHVVRHRRRDADVVRHRVDLP